MQIQPYLFFNGRCEEAIDFYRQALGAEVIMMLRYKNCPTPLDPERCPPESANRVMHASFRLGDTVVLASDRPSDAGPDLQGFTLSITVSDEGEADRLFAALAEGGNVHMPQEKTFFSPRFGMLVDRFGVSWMVRVAPRGTVS